MRLKGTVRTGAASSVATLSGLRFHVTGSGAEIPLNETFASDTGAYTATLERAITRLTVTPSLTTTAATLRYLDASDMELTDADRSTPNTHEIDLGESETVVKLEVTAENGVTKSVYTVTFSKADTVPPALNTATADWSALVLTYDEPLDDSSTPDPSAYSVSVDGGTGVAPSSVAVDGNAVTLTLATPVAAGQEVRVSYTKPAGMDAAPVQDVAGYDAGALTNRSVTNLTTGPDLQSATVSGSVLVMTYDVALDGNSVPDPDAFSVQASGQPRRIRSVAVSGGTVTLALASPVAAWQTVTMSYAAPRGTGATPIRNAAARPAASFTEEKVVNRTVDLRPPAGRAALVGNLRQQSLLTGKHAPFAQRFTTGDNAGGYVISGAELFLGRPYYPEVGARVQIHTDASNRPGRLVATLTSPARRRYEAVNTWTAPADLVLRPETRYFLYVAPIVPAGSRLGSGIWFRKTLSKSNDPGSASGWRIANRSRRPPYHSGNYDRPVQFAISGAALTIPTITGVAVTSTPQASAGTYGAGEVIEFTVTFGEAVTVIGEPHFVFSLGGTNVDARYDDSRSDGSRLVFGYTVQSGDSDSDGIHLLDGSDFRNRDGAVVLDGGETIRSTATSGFADLAHGGRGLQGGHKVDGSLSETTAPSTETATVDGPTLKLTYDEPLDETSVPMPSAFAVTAGGGAVTVSRVTVIDREVTLTLASPVKAGQTVTVSYTAPSGADATPVRDLVGNPAGSLTDRAVSNNTPGSEQAQGQVAVTGVPAVSEPAENGAYAANERIEARVRFDAPVVVDTRRGAPTLGLALGGVRREAAFNSGSGTAELVFSLKVPAAGTGAGIAKAIANGLRLNGATIRSEGGTDAVLEYGSAPGTVAVTVAEAPGGDGQWSPGEAVTVTVTFAEPVVVDAAGGTPSIGVLLGGSVAKRAAYTGGTDTATLTFAYRLVAADSAVNSVLVERNGLALDGGTIRSTAGLDAGLEHTGAGRFSLPPPNPLPVVSVADAQASEGETLAFVVTLEPPASAPVTVSYATADDSATAGSDYTAASGTLSFEAGESEKTVTVAVASDGETEGSETLTLSLSSPSGVTIGDGEATGTVTDPAPPPLTGEFRNVPAEHDGSNAFDLELHFSEAPKGLSYRTMRGSFFDVTNGTVKKAKRLVKKDNGAWRVTVEPDGLAEVIIGFLPALPADDCAEAAVVCTAGGTRLSVGAATFVPGPASLSVADATVREAPGATLDFVVSLSRARHEATTVDYATSDGTARAPDDYAHTEGTLTIDAGERERTVSVAVVDDSHDDGGETVVLTLSNAGAPTRIADATATGTIENSDPMPKAWLVRFGRTVGSQVLDALSERFDAPGRSHVTVGGVALRGGEAPGEAPARERDSLTLAGRGAETERAGPERTLTLDELVAGTRFHLSSGEPDAAGAAYTAWGRVATGGFDAEVDDVTLDGEVTTALVGFDAEWERALAGVMLSQSSGEGDYRDIGDDAGTVKSTLTGVYPYGRVAFSPDVSGWALAGVGSGELTLHRNGKKRMPTDIEMRMGAVGVHAGLLDAGDAAGLALALKSDAMWVSTKSEGTAELRPSEGAVTRLRFTVRGERPFALSGERTLTPSAEVGLRHDAGDAERGAGLELGAGLRYRAGAVTMRGRVRTLLAHAESGYEEWGASGSVEVAPGSGGRGLTLRVSPAWGATASAAERLWGARDAGELGLGDGRLDAEGRLDGEVGYGIGLARNRGLVTPYTALSLGEGAARTWRAGARWRMTDDVRVGLEGVREQAGGDAPTDAITLRAQVRF